MSKSHKTLFIFSIILLIITLSEIGYYLYMNIQKNNIQKTLNSTDEPIRKIPTYPYTDTARDISKEALDQQNLDKTIKNLKQFGKGVLKSSVIINEYEGEIVDIDKDGIVSNSVEYKVILSIKGRENNENTFFYQKDHIDLIKVVKTQEGKEEPITINDLNIGDQINIKESIDLTKDWENSVTEIKISKIN